MKPLFLISTKVRLQSWMMTIAVYYFIAGMTCWAHDSFMTNGVFVFPAYALLLFVMLGGMGCFLMVTRPVLARDGEWEQFDKPPAEKNARVRHELKMVILDLGGTAMIAKTGVMALLALRYEWPAVTILVMMGIGAAVLLGCAAVALWWSQR